MEKNGEIVENMKGRAQQNPVAWGGKTWPLKTPRTWTSSAHSLNNTKNGFSQLWNEEQPQKHERKIPGDPTAWERKTYGWIMAWACISKHLLAQEVKNTFSQIWVASQIRIWLPYSSEPHALTFPNQLIDDWAQKTEWVVDIFMGSPLDIWLFRIGSKVWIFPLPIPCEIMHPSL